MSSRRCPKLQPLPPEIAEPPTTTIEQSAPSSAILALADRMHETRARASHLNAALQRASFADRLDRRRRCARRGQPGGIYGITEVSEVDF